MCRLIDLLSSPGYSIPRQGQLPGSAIPWIWRRHRESADWPSRQFGYFAEWLSRDGRLAKRYGPLEQITLYVSINSTGIIWG